jgi:hypothetical protein
MSALT